MAVAALATTAVSDSAPRRAVALDVSVAGEGTLSAKGGIDCGERCDGSYRNGAVVRVTATPSTNETFLGWGRDCGGAALSCSVLLDRATRVRAVFVPIPRKVSMTVGGPGTIVSDPVGLDPVTGTLAGIKCGTQADLCAAMFGQGRTIILTPAPDADAVFGGWGGACEGQPEDPGRCELTVGANERVTRLATAWFRHRVAGIGRQTLTVDGYQGRNVTSTPQGILCGVVCTAGFASRTTVSLSGAATVWSGDCVGTVETCVVVVDAPLTVYARYLPSNTSGTSISYGVNVSVSGRGRVTVGRKIICDGKGGPSRKCDAGFDLNKRFTLVAKPARGNRFVKWADPFCRKAHSKRRCRLKVIDDLDIEAVFTKR